MTDVSNKSDDNVQSTPAIQGAASISGSEPDPESDDDTLQNAHEVGEQLTEDEEHPQEIDIARDVDAAEQAAHS